MQTLIYIHICYVAAFVVRCSAITLIYKHSYSSCSPKQPSREVSYVQGHKIFLFFLVYFSALRSQLLCTLSRTAVLYRLWQGYQERDKYCIS